MTTPADDQKARLAAARAGSADALGRALEAHRAYLLAVADRQLGPDLKAKGGASDVVQETFLDAHRAWALFHGSTEDELKAWLRALLLNRVGKVVRHYRQTQKRGLHREVALAGGDSASAPDPGLAAPTPTPSREVMADEQAAALRRALQRLPEDYRTAILLRYEEDLTFEEIGRRMQRTAEAARKLWWRAVERLQAEMEPAP
jgi:RNA polymerase sigma-70 factor, ECF subfamily